MDKKQDEDFNKQAEEFMEKSKAKADEYYNDFNESLLRTIRVYENYDIGFRAALKQFWDVPIVLIKAMIASVEEFCSTIYQTFIEDFSEYQRILFTMHVKAIRHSKEVLLLAEAGFGDGAFGRWRSLNETTVLLFAFVKGYHKGGLSVVEAFNDHTIIENYKLSIAYDEYSGKNDGYDSLNEDDLIKLRNSYEKVRSKHTSNWNEFKKQYGWLYTAQTPVPSNFKELSEYSETEEGNPRMLSNRPYYKEACNAIHSSPKSFCNMLGIYEDNVIAMSGQSIDGLFEPLQMCAIDFMQATKILLIEFHQFEFTSFVLGMEKILDDTKKELLVASNNVKEYLNSTKKEVNKTEEFKND